MQNYNILSINDLYFCKIFSDEVRKKPSSELQTKEGKWQISIINPDTIKEN